MSVVKSDTVDNGTGNGAAQDKLLDVVDLKKYFPVKEGFLSRKRSYVRAVDGVSFYIREGETMGLVGESGCGKTTTGRTILRLAKPTSGKVTFDGHDVVNATRSEIRLLRNKMQIIFQDPYDSLDPRMKLKDIVGEPLNIHRVGTRAMRRERVRHLLKIVGLGGYSTERYPHEFSGGQRQRIGVARALALNPKLIVCDEPVSALDVSIQSQILNLLVDLQEEFGLTYLFIAHDLGVVKHMSDRVGVMYLGKMVELARKDDLYGNPMHPYTQALLSAIPVPDPEAKGQRIVLEGDVPSPMSPPSGCRFQPRCREARPECSEIEPELKEVSPEHFVACHLASRLR